jgi:rod shape-determining protein MreD
MIKHKVIQFLLTLSILALQLIIMPFTGGASLAVNLLLCVAIIFSLKESRCESIIWAAVLGGLTDLLLFQHIGFYGISFILMSYILGFISHKMVISGYIPFFFVSLCSFILVFSLAILLMTLLEGRVELSLLLPPFILGLIITPISTLIIDFFYDRAEKILLKK